MTYDKLTEQNMFVFLKALIQLMAAAVAKRDMAYFTFGDDSLAKDLHNMYNHLKTNQVTVGM